jgi:hypothetical protein
VLERAPAALEPPEQAPAVPVPTFVADPEQCPTAHDALAAWVADLARELVHEPFQPSVYRERLEGCLVEWLPEVHAELERWLAEPPAADAEFVALASLGRAQSLPLSPAHSSRLRPLALREDLPFGLSVEAARALVAGNGADELAWWCAALESARDARARSIAAGALEALHGATAERFLVERALEIGDTRAAGRLLDALARALEQAQKPWENPARAAAASRLADLAGDERADAGLRARSLGLLRCLDPGAAERLASTWLLDSAAGPEQVEFAFHCLRGRAGALPALHAAQADPRSDAQRRVRLAECVLFTPDAQPDAHARAEALAEMRAAASDPSAGAARRRALHALAAFGDDEDRARVQQAAEHDPDALVRAAARTAQLREASDWH